MITLSNTPTLTTARLTLRAPQASDWPHWCAFAASTRAQYVGGPLDEGKAWRSFGHVIGMWVLRGYGSFVFHETGSDLPLGLCGPWHPADWPEREIGWTIWHPHAEGKGYAFEAATAARAFAFDVLHWPTAVSYIDPANARSIALATRLGATLDPDAPRMAGDTDLIFRHPRPEARA
jgi:RimJ/RimL family protein N-acetyltransferase